MAASFCCIWYSWNLWDILWFILRYFSIQFIEHLSSWFRTSLNVKSCTQSIKHISVSLLYDIKKSLNCLICSESSLVTSTGAPGAVEVMMIQTTPVTYLISADGKILSNFSSQISRFLDFSVLNHFQISISTTFYHQADQHVTLLHKDAQLQCNSWTEATPNFYYGRQRPTLLPWMTNRWRKCPTAVVVRRKKTEIRWRANRRCCWEFVFSFRWTEMFLQSTPKYFAAFI